MTKMLAHILLPLSLLAQTVTANAAEVKFYAGGGFRSVMTELAPMFQKATGHTVAATWDSAGGLERRLKAAEAFDVLFIGPDIVDGFIKQGKIVVGTRYDVARAGLGVAVRNGAPKPDVSTVAALRHTLSSAKSIAYVGEGMSGVYFVSMLDVLKMADEIKPKLKPLGVADVTKVVASGEADLVVYLMPALLADRGLDVAGPLPPDVQNYIVLATGLSAAAPQPEAARSLIAFLRSDAAIKVIREGGW